MTQILTQIRRLKIEVWRMEEMVSPKKEKLEEAPRCSLTIVSQKNDVV